MQAWLNGQIVAEEKANISIFDRSYLYGEGVFETLKSYHGKLAFFGRHYRRLKENCTRLSIPLPLPLKDLEDACSQLLNVNDLKEAVVRMTASMVGASFGVGRPQSCENNISIFCRPFVLDPRLFETGVKVLPLTTLINEAVQTANIKSTSYLVKMIARMEAAKVQAYDSLLKNSKGFWVEGSKTNLFIVLDHGVVTPPLNDGLLGGITREVVLEILKEKKIPYREDHITDLMLQNAEEIFLTGSTSEVMPVCEVMGMWQRKVANNSTIKKLLKEYRMLVSEKVD